MRRKNTQMTTNILIISLLLIGVVYALLQSNLQINGIAKILHNTWDVHFDNIQVNEDSVPIVENDSQATIDPENNCKIDFEVTLNIPGDFYEFTVDVVNEGTIDGMIGTLNKTLTINNEIVQEVPDYLNYSITYDDGVEIEENHKVSAGTVETYKVRLEFKTDIEELPQAATIVTSLEPQYVQADSSAVEVYHPTRLYNVFASEYNNGSGLVREYTGEHKDSFTKNGTQKIYHWYAGTYANTDANTVLNKWNVLFGGFCWQAYRTTDTGGVKLLYNGEAENNQCLNTRAKHIGYNYTYNTSLDSNYWYGTDFEYDSSTQKYTLVGDVSQKVWNDQTWQSLIGKYTCCSISNSPCSYIYLVESYGTSTTAKTISLSSNISYPIIGSIPFNSDNDYVNKGILSYVGYKYGDSYPYTRTGISTADSFSEKKDFLPSKSASVSFWYANSIEYDTVEQDKYSLVNPYRVNSSTSFPNLVGKYTFKSSNENYFDSTVYYIVGVKNGVLYYIELKDGNLLSAYEPLIIGDSISDNHDGTYTLEDRSTITYSNWFDHYLDYKNKYICNGTDLTCTNPKYITDPYYNLYYYIDAAGKIMISKRREGLSLVDYLLVNKLELVLNKDNYSDYLYTCNNESTICTEKNLRLITSITSNGYNYISNYYWGESVSWDGEKYSLINPIPMEYYNDSEAFSTHHYRCNSIGVTSCTNIQYVYYANNSNGNNYYYYYIILKNGITVDQALDSMFSNNNNSIVKNAIDSWYKRSLLNYGNYLEDIIFCNDRFISNYSGWNPNGGVSGNLYFSSNNGLICNRIQDQFSINNNQASLMFPIGLVTRNELALLNNNKIYNLGESYWTLTPNIYYESNGFFARNFVVNEYGNLNATSVLDKNGVRPVISLKAGTKFDDGDGSMEHPYIIKTN